MATAIGGKGFFQNIPEVKFEGLASDNPFVYKWYDENSLIAGKPIKEWLRFGFGYDIVTNCIAITENEQRLYLTENRDAVERAIKKADMVFKLIAKLGLNYYYFQDLDVVEHTNDVEVNEERFRVLTEYLQQKQNSSGTKLLWGSANLISHDRYADGAFANPDFHVIAHAGAQVKTAIDGTIELNGENYVFKFGHSDYNCMVTPRMKRERDMLARFLHTAKDYARQNKFIGNFFIEPQFNLQGRYQKHNYHEKLAHFLNRYGLLTDFKLNVDLNYSAIGTKKFQQEIYAMIDAGLVGGINVVLNDWHLLNASANDNQIKNLTELMQLIIKTDNLKSGISIMMKWNPAAVQIKRLLVTCIDVIDTFTKALVMADEHLQSVNDRQIWLENKAFFNTRVEEEYMGGKLTLEKMQRYAIEHGEPQILPGNQPISLSVN